MTNHPSKPLICRFHGGDMDGTFDSRIDRQYGSLPRESMIHLYRRCRKGNLQRGLSESAMLDLSNGTPLDQLTGRNSSYLVMDRSESDDLIQLEFVSVVVEVIDGKECTSGTFNGREFRSWSGPE